MSHMLVSTRRHHPALGGSFDQPALDEIRLVNFLNGPHFFGTGDGKGFQTDGSAVIMFDKNGQNFSVHFIKPHFIHIKTGKGVSGLLLVNGALSENAGEITHAPKQSVGDTRSAPRTFGDFHGRPH